MKVRLVDIAKKIGVSQSMVTRVVKNNGYVSKEKREIILNALSEAGYILPHTQENCFDTTPVILFYTPSELNSFGNILFSKILEETAIAFQEIGWHLDPYFLNDESPEQIMRSIQKHIQPSLKGIVFNCYPGDLISIHSFLTSLSVPVIMLERSPNIYGLNKIMLHSKESVFQIVRYLHHLGHSQIVFLGKKNSSILYNDSIERQRIEGFMEGIETMGIADTSCFLSLEEYGYENGYAAIRKHLTSNPLPTAIIAADSVLVGVSNYLYQMNIRIPKDVSLVGIDDTYARYTSPLLTSVRFPIAEIVQSTIRILKEYQEGITLPQCIMLSSMLIERESAAAPRDYDIVLPGFGSLPGETDK